MWFLRAASKLKLIGRSGLALLYALRHPETPSGIKLGIVLLIAYTVSPIDLIPDMVLVFGWADDAAALLVGIPYLLNRLPESVRQDCALRVERLLARFGVAPGSRD